MRKLRIAELRKEHGYTLKELGEKLGVRDNTLSQYETGKRQPQLGFLYELADFFHVSLDYLTGETETRDFEINSEIDAIRLIEKLDFEEVDSMNLSKKTALELAVWIVKNKECFEETPYNSLKNTAFTFVNDVMKEIDSLKKYSELRLKEHRIVEQIYEKVTSDEYAGASPNEVLEFIKQSERIEFEEIKKILNTMKKLPDRTK